jgi:hypothetical protein
MSREELVEREAKRRCIRDDYTLDYLACQDRRYRHDNMTPYWKAEYARHVECEIKRLEEAGFTVSP